MSIVGCNAVLQFVTCSSAAYFSSRHVFVRMEIVFVNFSDFLEHQHVRAGEGAFVVANFEFSLARAKQFLSGDPNESTSSYPNCKKCSVRSLLLSVRVFLQQSCYS